MINKIKRAIQRPLIEKRHRLYEKQAACQKVSYDVWLRQTMEKERQELSLWKEQNGFTGALGSDEASGVISVSYEEMGRWLLSPGSSLKGFCQAGEQKKDNATEIFLVSENPEKLAPGAAWMVKRFFMEQPDCEIVYGDEEGWFKPGWSPERLQSFFYFGNVFAVKKDLIYKVKSGFDIDNHGVELIKERNEIPLTEIRKALYRLVLACIDETKEAGHIESILYLPRRNGEQDCPEEAEGGREDWGMESDYETLKKGHFYSDREVSEKKQEQKSVSVIIPSRDNPAVLSVCIHSLRENTAYRNMEIIVVDNGSREENRERILEMQRQLKEEFSFRYLYEPMEFNFSRMCNLGAAQAGGEYLLFLNDDIEVAKPEWLTVMMSRAMKPGAGAVGAKLLYPDSHNIQHVGITNIHLGPAHKLQFLSDEKIYYHGYNRQAVNVSAVTGACLLVKKEVFEEAGGFSEKMEVAFNDVELCFHIGELGYRNICCNDTFLYHHESLSRGADAGMEKISRLHRERDLLYSRHPEMWNRDRYYSDYLVSDILDRGFLPKSRFSEEVRGRGAEAERADGSIRPEWYNECLYMGVEFAGDENGWKLGKPGGGDYYIQGWSYAVNVDNSCYEKSLLLKCLKTGQSAEGEEEMQQVDNRELWKLPIEDCYRPDMEENLPYINRPALSGVSLWIKRDALPPGEYLIGYFWEDTCSRQKLYGFSAETLSVENRT